MATFSKSKSTASALLNIKTGVWFDSREAVRYMRKDERRRLNSAGRDIQFAARRLIRKRKGASLPGHPPHYHDAPGISFRRSILRAYDVASKSVVIGAIKFGSSSVDVPGVLEYGGTSRAYGKRDKVASRPFISTAYEKTKSKIQNKWKTNKW